MMNRKSLNPNLLHLRPARAQKQDSEGQIEKLGSQALEPRPVSLPPPGSEGRYGLVAMTPPSCVGPGFNTRV